MNPYSNAIYAEMTHEKSSCCKQWTVQLMPSVKNRKCIILSVLISAIVLLVAALVVVLFLTVGGGMELFSSSSKSETVQKGNTVVNGTFRISSVAYDVDLADPSTKLYDILRLEVSNAVFTLFNKSSIGENYNRSELIGFRNGSVAVDFRVFLSTPVEDVAAKVTSAFVKGLVNMHGTVLLDKFVVDIRSIAFKVDDSFEASFLKSSTSSAAVHLKSPESSTLASTSSSSHESTTAVSQQHPSAVKTAFSGHSYQLPDSSPSLSSSSTPATSTAAVLLQRQTPSSTTQRTLHKFRPSSFPVVSAAAPHLKMPWNSGNNATTTTTTPLSPILSSAASSAFRTPYFSKNSSNNRPSHPFLRPPPTGSYPTYSRTRPGIPSHFQMDFADSPGWSSWSAWSACGNGLCVVNRNYTQMRTRDCRTRNGSGEVLTDNKECLLKQGGMRFEIRRCTCKLGITATSIITTTAHPNFTGRPCYECTADEICLAKHSDKEATCRPPLDAKDATGCGGWCDPAYEYCQHLATGAKKCIDDRGICLPDEWQCGNGLCVPLEKRCDGHFNCYDTTDELNCKCDEQKNIRCGKNTSCLPVEKRCNFIIDCWDGSDEENCTKKCPIGQFTCTYGQCIPNMYFCDGLIDCQDGSDEPEGCNDTCKNGEFRCANGRCIKQALVCDGTDTCGDGSDERTSNCSRRVYVPAFLSTRTLSRRDADIQETAFKRRVSPSFCPNATHFMCSSGLCISKDSVCDGRLDCLDGEDERNCSKMQISASPSAKCVPNEEFQCTNSRCINLKNICDSVDHCGDSSDESAAVCQHRDSSH